ncbi:hypothetical protein PN471_10700 [Aphanizomenon sp. CS-733/32]|uniref:hypothetical protein n=1 Tax=Aphanizomenon sp. CS-733/32 TaxID=3021715 RepID=UPI00232DD004|nr:hypothetical protein [Aphanizomenon sp. CS-733/32]MDB9309098.1 hypothetical protein [Aphanizomenon sp. CS-733/32]
MKNPEIRNLALFLKCVINSRGQIDEKFDSSNGTEGHGYEIVQDLILNAERRATQQRYDDAVGRLYRALELLAQIRLLKAFDNDGEIENELTIPPNWTIEKSPRLMATRLVMKS